MGCLGGKLEVVDILQLINTICANDCTCRDSIKNKKQKNFFFSPSGTGMAKCFNTMAQIVLIHHSAFFVDFFGRSFVDFL